MQTRWQAQNAGWMQRSGASRGESRGEPVQQDAQEEEAIRQRCARGQQREALELVLRLYQAELYGFLVARFPGQHSLADDAYSALCEDLLRGLAGFEWRCTVRSWCYRLARSAATRVGRAEGPVGRRAVCLDAPSADAALAHVPRTSTAPYLRDDVRERVARLREALSVSDRELLTLRIDRNLSWREIALVMLPLPVDDDGREQRRNEAALRQRFAEVKKRLRKRAGETGLG